jgi:hypothetical protein
MRKSRLLRPIAEPFSLFVIYQFKPWHRFVRTHSGVQGDGRIGTFELAFDVQT